MSTRRNYYRQCDSILVDYNIFYISNIVHPLPRIENLYRECLQTQIPSVQENGNILQQHWSELEWQALWYSGACGASFRATNGALVEVVQFGFWNREPGPDFIRACIRVDGGPELQGDIEFDIRALDWEQHQHSQNSSYDGVILHVFLHRPGATFFTQTSNHYDVLQVHLKPDLLPNHLSLAPGIARIGACAAPLRQLRPTQIDKLLETAALVRIQRKAEQLQRAIRIHGIDEALFQAIAIALGYKSNKVPFLIIAQRAPLVFLKQRADSIEAILFGLSGFLETRHQRKRSDSGTVEYLQNLWKRWWRYRGELHHLILGPRHWHLTGSRPQNHPLRRIGALATIIQHWHELRVLPPDFEVVQQWFLGLSHPFWDYHYTLRSAMSQRPLHLIGESRTKEILANVICPMSIVSDQQHWQAFKQLKSELGNKHLEIVCCRLFGGVQEAGTYTKFLYQQQGLLQIFEDFCLVDTTDCAKCNFPKMVSRIASLYKASN